MSYMKGSRVSETDLKSYTIRYDYSDGRLERQGSYVATKIGLEMADMNAKLQNTLTQIGETEITATVEEVRFINGSYEYREVAR
jgi:hypothetical protein